jgi:hypothetical protein
MDEFFRLLFAPSSLSRVRRMRIPSCLGRFTDRPPTWLLDLLRGRPLETPLIKLKRRPAHSAAAPVREWVEEVSAVQALASQSAEPVERTG